MRVLMMVVAALCCAPVVAAESNPAPRTETTLRCGAPVEVLGWLTVQVGTAVYVVPFTKDDRVLVSEVESKDTQTFTTKAIYAPEFD